MRPMVSIVMPVYNSEKYLSEALNSILRQTYSDYEVICVDDGSTDRSIDILKEFVNRDTRIKYICQKNQFAGIARNTGMDMATGKYLMFLDADDIFEKNMLSTLVPLAEKNNTDIIYFGFYKFTTSIRNRSMIGISFHSKKVCSPMDHKEDIFQIAMGYPWNKLYNREFVINTGIKFQGLKSDNDQYFTRTIVLEANRILFLNKRFVNYRINNSDSIQGNYQVDSGNLTESTFAIYTKMIERGEYTIYKDSFEKYVIRRYFLTFDKCNSYDSFCKMCSQIRASLEKININEQSKVIKSDPAYVMWKMILENNTEEALFNLYDYTRLYYCPKNAIEYRIGSAILKRLHLRSYD